MMSKQQQPHSAEDVQTGAGQVPRRSVLRGLIGGAAGVVAANSLAPGVARAQGTPPPPPPPGGSDYQDDYNMEATREGTRRIPFYGQYQAGIGTPPQTAATFLAFDVTAANRAELTNLFRT